MSTDDGTISYNYAQCENIYEDLVQDQATISAQISSLENTINSLRRTWTGLSADQWQNTQDNWMVAIHNMAANLKNASSTLPEMAANMKHTDSAAADRIASIARSLRCLAATRMPVRIPCLMSRRCPLNRQRCARRRP